MGDIMRLIMLSIMLILCSWFVIGQAEVPVDVSTTQHKLIQQEHANTRTFMSDEFQRQKDQMLKDFDERANYYENEFNSTVSTAVYKLTLLWAGVVLVIMGLSTFLRLRFERRRYDKLKTSVADYVLREKEKEKVNKELKLVDRFLKKKPEPEPVPPPPPPPTYMQYYEVEY